MKRLIACLLLGASCSPAVAFDPAPSPRAVVEAKFAAVNRHEIDAVAAFYAPNTVVTASDFCAPRQGRDEVVRTYRAIFAAVPDIQASIDSILVNGDEVAARVTLRGQIGGRAFALPIANFFTVTNGLITADRGFFDNFGRPCTP